MNSNPLFLLICIACCSVLLMSSCSTTKYDKSYKYSTLGKRHKDKQATVADKNYSKIKDSNSRKNDHSILNRSGLRTDIISTAMSYVGTPYKPGGKTPDSGFDCSGFTRFVFSQHGIRLSGSSDQLATLGKNKIREELMPGDLVFFGNDHRISHVAIVSENDDHKLKVVHATTSAGVKTDLISGYEYWESRFLFGKDMISKPE